MEGSLNLQLLADKNLHQPVDTSLIAYGPSMDLVALGGSDHQILVYRLNGQRVYSAPQKPNRIRAQRICWKPNGRLLATTWSDGSVRLIGAESSKTVHQFSTGENVSGITCIGWTSTLTSSKPSSDHSKGGEGSWDALLAQMQTQSEITSSLDLPRDLALIDIEPSLPKLSALSADGPEDVFSSRASLDAVFHPFDPRDENIVDVMVIGTREGDIHLSIYDSFIVGSFASPLLVNNVPSQLVLHASHEEFSTQALLMKTPGSRCIINFVPMDLRFIRTTSNYLSLLASRSTALQNLLRYIHQTQTLMANELKSAQELPSKFLQNINETLEENGGGNIVQALFHSVATGHTFPTVKEWLVDELAERGHKRWDKAVVAGLQNLSRLVHESMLPALDRCSIILSRLSGVSKFQGTNNTVGFSNHQIALLMDTLACLRLVCSKILVQAVDELELFTAFSTWLRYEIDKLASDSSLTLDDAAEKEASINHAKVLLYLRTCLPYSPLEIFFSTESPNDSDREWADAKKGLPIFDALSEQLQKQEKGKSYLKGLLRVDLIIEHMKLQANDIFSQIAIAEKRNVLFGDAINLGETQSDTTVDMIVSRLTENSCSCSVAFLPKDNPNQVFIAKIILLIENGISTIQRIDSAVVQIGDGKIHDLKFLDDEGLLVLWEWNGPIYLLRLPYSTLSQKGVKGFSEQYNVDYTPHDSTSSGPVPSVIESSRVLSQWSNCKIMNEEDPFRPEKIEIRRNSNIKGMRESERVFILGNHGLRYRVYTISGTDSPPQGIVGEDVVMSQ